MIYVTIFTCILGLSNDHDILERTRKSLETGMKAANLTTRLGCLHGILYLVQCDNPEVICFLHFPTNSKFFCYFFYSYLIFQVITEVNTHIMPFVLDYLQTYLQHYATPHVGVCEGKLNFFF